MTNCFAQNAEVSTESGVQVRLLLGPAGCGKTHRCLAEIRERLAGGAEGGGLLLIAPKQNTFTLERDLLGKFDLQGFTRLHILSFERLATLIYRTIGLPEPDMLNEEGRAMTLRSLLTRKRDELQLFRASARLTGFARQLSLALHELQRNQVDPQTLRTLAEKTPENPGLALKLKEVSTLFEGYQERLQEYGLQDSGSLLETATRTLNEAPEGVFWDTVWVDGFADLSAQEVELLAAVMRRSREGVLTLCIDPGQAGDTWLSPWWVTRRSLKKVERRFQSIPGLIMRPERLERGVGQGRFKKSPVLARLECLWAGDIGRKAPVAESASQGHDGLRVVVCETPEAEAAFAAGEIRRHVRSGGRYRETLVLVRSLEHYAHALRRAFTRHKIPFFMDRREPVTHHPLAELTRNALRTVAFDWDLDDWLAVLKTGLVDADEEEIDRLENEALSRGWTGQVWREPLRLEKDPELEKWVRALQDRLVPPFLDLAERAKGSLTGPQLADLLVDLWRKLKIEARLSEWAAPTVAQSAGKGQASNRGEMAGAERMVHGAVWAEMNAWLDNIRLAFEQERFTVKEWLPILDAGLAGLSVGLIPPALDQALVGAIDRSRNPEARLVLVLGMNETVFPAAPQGSALLTEADRELLEQRNLLSGASAKEQLSRERHLAYVACTRASESLVLSYALNDSSGSPLNPSPFISQVQRLLPGLEVETGSSPEDQAQPGVGRSTSNCALVFVEPEQQQTISSELAARLYGNALQTSVSRLEQFAACPFRFYLHSGLRVQERRLFEADSREQGSFQHDLLARFHESVQQEGKRWRDLTPAQARERVQSLAEKLRRDYHDGLLETSGQNRFLAGVLAKAVEDFVGVTVEWMREQYEFDPVAVELPFGEKTGAPAWGVDLNDGKRLELRGRIDRIDICRKTGEEEAWCVVLDYKSSQKQLDPILVEHGLQLQLLGYLNVLGRWPGAAAFLGASGLRPAGVFYVNLKGASETTSSRAEALANADELRRSGFCHTGRFDRTALELLDRKAQERGSGDQFKYRLTKAGEIYKNCKEPMERADFTALLDRLEDHLKRLGNAIYAGDVSVSPYRKGSAKACDYCEYSAICRLDTWRHRFRVLRAPGGPERGRGEQPLPESTGVGI